MGFPATPVYVMAGNSAEPINIKALCAAPPEALAHSPSQMPLSCLVAPLSQRELHKDGGGGGGGEWRGEEGARRPGPEGHAQHTRTPLHPAALASVPYGIVLVRVRMKMKRATMSTFNNNSRRRW